MAQRCTESPFVTPSPNPKLSCNIRIQILIRNLVLLSESYSEKLRNANSSKHKGTPSIKNISYTILLKIKFSPHILALSIKNVILEYSILVYKTSALSRLTCPKENTKMSIYILPSCKYCNYTYTGCPKSNRTANFNKNINQKQQI